MSLYGTGLRDNIFFLFLMFNIESVNMKVNVIIFLSHTQCDKIVIFLHVKLLLMFVRHVWVPRYSNIKRLLLLCVSNGVFSHRTKKNLEAILRYKFTQQQQHQQKPCLNIPLTICEVLHTKRSVLPLMSYTIKEKWKIEIYFLCEKKVSRTDITFSFVNVFLCCRVTTTTTTVDILDKKILFRNSHWEKYKMFST